MQTVLAVVSTFTKQCERLASLFPASRHHGTPSLTDTGKVHPACEGAMIDLPFHYSMAVIVLADDYRFIVTGVLLLGFPLGACRSLCYLASPSGPAVRHLNEYRSSFALPLLMLVLTGGAELTTSVCVVVSAEGLSFL